MGSPPDHRHPHSVHPTDGHRQRPRNPQRIHLQTPQNRPELLHSFPGGGGPHRGHPGHAPERGLLGPGPLDVRQPHLQDVAHIRRLVLHRFHSKLVRDSPGPVLGDYRPHKLRAKAHGEESASDDSRGVDFVTGDQLAAAHWLERLARRNHRLQTHGEEGVRGVFFPGVVLYSSFHHDGCVRGDLRGDEKEIAGKSAGFQDKRDFQESNHCEQE